MGVAGSGGGPLTRGAGTAALAVVPGVVVLGWLRLFGPESLGTGGPERFIPLLLALGFLCVVALARHEHRTSAWLAAIAAGFAVTVDLASHARVSRPTLAENDWRLVAIAVSVSAVVAIGAATAYAATRPRLRRRWLTVEAVVVLVAIAGLAAWAVANPEDATIRTGSALGSLALVTRSFIVLTAAMTVLGVVGDAIPAAERAARRIVLTHGRPASRADRTVGWARAFIDELSPGRTTARRAVLEERTRVARDIHADVVPGLRQVLLDAERGTSPDRLATALRDVLDDVEAVGLVQHPIQLEIGGLVAALEWLVERVERRSGVTITIDIDDAGISAPGEPPADVAAAAFRVAALALGNVVRHAPGSQAAIRVATARDQLQLSICDDGPGLDDAAVSAARAAGRRGIRDMVTETGACGAGLTLRPNAGGGTCVDFRWSAVSAA